jgi:hypothetical protein
MRQQGTLAATVPPLLRKVMPDSILVVAGDAEAATVLDLCQQQGLEALGERLPTCALPFDPEGFELETLAREVLGFPRDGSTALPPPLAAGEDEGPWVVPLSAELRHIVAHLQPSALDEVAARWQRAYLEHAPPSLRSRWHAPEFRDQLRRFLDGLVRARDAADGAGKSLLVVTEL